MDNRVTSFRLNEEERALIAQLQGAQRGDASKLVRRLLREEAARKGITVLRTAAPRQKAA